jgi:hypothetical protein
MHLAVLQLLRIVITGRNPGWPIELAAIVHSRRGEGNRSEKKKPAPEAVAAVYMRHSPHYIGISSGRLA